MFSAFAIARAVAGDHPVARAARPACPISRNAATILARSEDDIGGRPPCNGSAIFAARAISDTIGGATPNALATCDALGFSGFSRSAFATLVRSDRSDAACRRGPKRRAFDATLADKDFLDEAAERGLDVNPVSGSALDKLVGDLYATPPDVIAEAKSLIAKGGQ